MSEPIYMFRRKGQDAFCTCDAERHAELSGHPLFEVAAAHTASDYDALSAECERLRNENARLEELTEKAQEHALATGNKALEMVAFEVECHQLRARLAELEAPAQSFEWPKLEKPAKVGAGRFAAGVSSRLVVEAAQRQHEYEQEPPFTDAQIAAVRDTLLGRSTPAQAEGLEEVAWQVRRTYRGSTANEYTEQLPFVPGEGVSQHSEPVALVRLVDAWRLIEGMQAELDALTKLESLLSMGLNQACSERDELRAQLAQRTEAERDWAASLSLWAKGKFSPASGRYIGQICGNTDWALAQVVWSAAMEYRVNATQEGESQ